LVKTSGRNRKRDHSPSGSGTWALIKLGAEMRRRLLDKEPLFASPTSNAWTTRVTKVVTTRKKKKKKKRTRGERRRGKQKLEEREAIKTGGDEGTGKRKQ